MTPMPCLTGAQKRALLPAPSRAAAGQGPAQRSARGSRRRAAARPAGSAPLVLSNQHLSQVARTQPSLPYSLPACWLGL